MSETEGPSVKDMQIPGAEASGAIEHPPRSLTEAMRSPDFIVVNGSRAHLHADAPRFPQVLFERGIVTHIGGETPSETGFTTVALNVARLAKEFHHGVVEEHPEFMGDMMGVINAQLREFHGPETYAHRRELVAGKLGAGEFSTIDDVADAVSIKNTFADSFISSVSEYPGQLLAMDKLLTNDDFQAAVAIDRRKNHDDTGINPLAIDKTVLDTSTLIHEQSRQITAFVEDEDWNEFLQEHKIDTSLVPQLSRLADDKHEYAVVTNTYSSEAKIDNSEADRYIASPDHFIFNAGHAEHISSTLPDLLLPGASGTEVAKDISYLDNSGNEKQIMPVHVAEFANYISTHANDQVKDPTGKDVDVLSYVTDFLTVELRQMVSVDMLLTRFENNPSDYTISKLKEATKLYPGQLLALTTLLKNETFKNTVDTYTVAHPTATHIQDRMQEMRRLLGDNLEGFAGMTPNQVTLMDSHDVPVPDDETRERMKEALAIDVIDEQ